MVKIRTAQISDLVEGGGGGGIIVGPLLYTSSSGGQLVYEVDFSFLLAAPTQNGTVAEITGCATRGNYARLIKHFASFRKNGDDELEISFQGSPSGIGFDDAFNGIPTGSLAWAVTDALNGLAELQWSPGGAGDSEVTARIIFTPDLP